MAELDQWGKSGSQRSTRAILGSQAGDPAGANQECLAGTALCQVEILIAQGRGRQAGRHSSVQQFLVELVDRLAKCGGDRTWGAKKQASRFLRQSVELPALAARRFFQLEVEKEEIVDPTTGRPSGGSEGQGPGWGRLKALPTRDVH
jgi:hypothetical protein